MTDIDIEALRKLVEDIDATRGFNAAVATARLHKSFSMVDLARRVIADAEKIAALVKEIEPIVLALDAESRERIRTDRITNLLAEIGYTIP